MFWRTENKIQPKKNFRLEIEDYYNGVSNNEIPKEQKTEIMGKLTEKI